MKILLLNPPRRDNIVMVKEGRCMQREGAWGYVMSPVTMVTIATMLKEDGHEVKVIDAGVDANNFNKLISIINSFAPEIVFINTSTTTIEDDMFSSKFVKTNCPSVKITVLFGIHVSVLYEDVLKSENLIDFCIIGEPEITIRELVIALKNNSSVKNVNGLAFLENGKVIKTEDRGFIKNLDELPIPDWSFVNTNNYRLPFSGEKFLLVNTNRGCPYRCTFCNAYVYYGRIPRHRSVDHIIKELKNDVEKFKVTNFMIWTEEFILDKPFVKDLCKAIIKENLKIKWVCNSRVDAVDEDILKTIKEAGCWNIAYGIESGNQEILDAIKKQITLEQIRRAVLLAKKANLKVTGHVIIGFPEDTYETIKKTEKFVNSLDLDFVQYYCAMPYPGTELYEKAKQNGWINSNDWKLWEHNFSVLDYPHLKAKDIMRLRTSLFIRYYLQPKIIIRTLKSFIKKPKHIPIFIKNLKEFFKWI